MPRPLNREWIRGDLQTWLASHSPERRQDDDRRLAHLFSLAANVPMLDTALRWGQSHGIKIIVDRDTNVGGCYFPSSGIVNIALDSLDYSDCFAVGALVHELRHAWQDFYGMISTRSEKFPEFFIKTCLIEADARAHQRMAERQFLSSQDKVIRALTPHRSRIIQWNDFEQTVPIFLPPPQAKPNIAADLWRDFADWYRSDSTKFYGHRCVSAAVRSLNISMEDPFITKLEFEPYDDDHTPLYDGIDYSRWDTLRQLGESFNGTNYFDVGRRLYAWEEADFEKTYLSPGRAASFFSKSNRPEIRFRPIETATTQAHIGSLKLKRNLRGSEEKVPLPLPI